MPEIYDPSGGSGFRARRRRKRKQTDDPPAAAPPAAAPPAIPQPEPKLSIQNPPSGPSKVLASLSAAHRRPRAKAILSKRRKYSAPATAADPFSFPQHEEIMAGNDTMPSLGEHNGTEKKKKSMKTPPTRLHTTVVTVLKDAQPGDANTDISLPGPTTAAASNGCLLRQAVAIDTRCLNTPEGKEEYQNIHQGVAQFLQSSCHRGVPSSCIAWSGTGPGEKMLCESVTAETLEGIMKKLASGTTVDVSTSGIPEGLTVTETWSLFGKMITTLVDHESSKQKAGNSSAPVCITIFSSVITSLLDTNADVHSTEIDKFMKGVEPFFDGILQAIRIVFVQGTATVASTSALTSSQQNREEKSPLRDVESDTTETLFQMRSHKMSLLISHLRQWVEAKIEEVFVQNRSQIQFDTKAVSRMDVTLSAIDSRLGFHGVLQRWSQDALASRSQTAHQALQLQLPETPEFDGCVVSLQASHKILPFRLNSPKTFHLLSELEALSRAKLETIQLIPIESIDASLLFGVAIVLRAGLTDSTEEHNQNVMLLQSIFKFLARKDCALLVRATHPIREESLHKRLGVAQDVQYFVLMPGLLGTKDGRPTTNGVLYSTACSDHILEETSTGDTQQALRASEVAENPFEECVEASLDALDCSSFNPFSFRSSYQHQNPETESPSIELTTTEHKRVTWKDDTVCNTETTETASNVKLCLAEAFEKAVDLGAMNDSREESTVWKDDSGVGLLMQKEEAEKRRREDDMQQDGEMECFDSSPTDTKSLWKDDSGVGSVMKLACDNPYEQKSANDTETAAEQEESVKDNKSPEKELQSPDHSSSKNSIASDEETEIKDDIDTSSDDDDTVSSQKKRKRKPTEIAIQRSSPREKEAETEWQSASVSGSSSSCSSNSDTETSDDGDDDSELGRFEY